MAVERASAIRVAATGFMGIILLAAAAAAQTEELAPKSVADVTEIMKALVIPSSNAIWNVGRKPPEDKAAWEALKNSAVLLAESGNLLLIGERAKDDETWRKTSLMMVDAGAAALKAAKAENPDEINAAGNLAADACEMCHELHWKR